MNVGEAAAVGDLQFLQPGPVSPAWRSSRRVIELRVIPGWRAWAHLAVYGTPPWLGSVPGHELHCCNFPAGRRMPPAAVPVTLAASQRKTLKKRVRGAKTCWRDRLRAQIVLLAARGQPNARIAADLGVDDGTARKWRGRFAELGLAGLEDLPRPGRPRRIPETDRAAAVALACQLPAQTGVPLSRWTGPELAAELTAQCLVSAPMSPSSVRRILAENPVKPWRYQSWLFPRDPDFAAKAQVILDLYQGFYQGEPLGPGDKILSFDAKPSIQARSRATCPPRRAGPCGWSTSTCAAARSRCSPAWTSVPGRCSPPPRRRRESSRSWTSPAR